MDRRIIVLFVIGGMTGAELVDIAATVKAAKSARGAHADVVNCQLIVGTTQFASPGSLSFVPL